MKNVKRLWKYFKDNKLFILMALLASAVVSATDGATAYLVKDILDEIFIAKNKDMLRLIPPIVIIVIYGIRLAARFIQSYFIQFAGHHAVQNIRKDLYHKMIHLPMGYYDKNDTGAMMHAS